MRGSSTPDRRRGMGRLALVAGAALATYFLDPISGRRRRHVTRDRTLALFRRTGRVLDRRARWASGHLRGMAVRADLTHREQPPPDDVTLARKVETVVFRDADVPKGDISVNAANGVVTLRGTAPTPEMIRRLERDTAAIAGVAHVQNLLHLPGTPAQAAAPGSEGGPIEAAR